MSTENQKNISSLWFSTLQKKICKEFEQLEADFINKKNLNKKPSKFHTKNWQREEGMGGGGTMAVMQGLVFEKVGVNISTVYGKFSEEFQAEIPGADKDPLFWASGISLVAHMKNPHVPAVHMNTRHIVTSKSWFGGGADLSPVFSIEKDTKAFHKALKNCCDRHDSSYYPKFKKWADDYFFIPHRNENRGVGGIFYDYINSGNWTKDFSFTQDVGNTFLKIYSQLVREYMTKPWTEEEKIAQLKKRGRYVEFNLLYDRGTRFGFKTGGYTDAILMSMPPTVIWSSPLEDVT